MHLPNIFKHHSKDKTDGTTTPPTDDNKKQQQELPKGFRNDSVRGSNSKPDTLYGFDDPTARRLGPVPSTDPTNTGA